MSTPHVLVSAYASDPERGSEPGVGFRWIALYLAAGCRVTAVVHRDRGGGCARTRAALAVYAARLRLVEVEPGRALRALRALPGCWYLYYRAYLARALAAARAATAADPADWIHHVSQNGYREPGGWYRFGPPLVWGPIGGLQDADPRLVRAQGGWIRLAEMLRALANRHCARFGARPRAARAAARVLLAANPEAATWARRGRRAVVRELLETAADTIDGAPPGWSGRAGVLWVGSDEARKNPEFALLAFALLRRAAPETTLTMVGLSSARERALRAWARRRRVPLDGVAVLPRQPRAALVALYRRARLFWFTSWRDTSGNVLLEAMGRGTPCVAFAHQGAAAILAGVPGALVAPGPLPRAVRAWARASLRSLCDQRAWSASAEAGTNRLLERYRWDAKWPVLDEALRSAGVLPAGGAASSPCSAPTAPASRPCSPPCASGSPPTALPAASSTGASPGACVLATMRS